MPEIRSGRPGPDLNRRKNSPVKLMVGVAAVAVIAVGVGWGLTHLPGGSPGAPGGDAHHQFDGAVLTAVQVGTGPSRSNLRHSGSCRRVLCTALLFGCSLSDASKWPANFGKVTKLAACVAGLHQATPWFPALYR